jgi:hypothetical protein
MALTPAQRSGQHALLPRELVSAPAQLPFCYTTPSCRLNPVTDRASTVKEVMDQITKG